MLSLSRFLCNGCGKCVQVCYAEALKLLGQPMTAEELLTEVKKDTLIYRHSGGGVTISGGEPLIDFEFNKNLLRIFKEESITVGINTCGHVPYKNVERLLPYIDFFLWDIKHMDPEKHRVFTGVTNDLILSNLLSISDKRIPLYIRIPIIPHHNDTEENIRATCEFTCGLPSVVELDLLPLHHLGKSRYESLNRPYPIDGLPLIPDAILQDLKRLVESYGLRCTIGG
jgi:pyruvate formate lyase activating enzyme